MSSHEGCNGCTGCQVNARRQYRASPIESTPPLVDLTNPQPVAARRETRRLLAGGGLTQDAEEGLVGAVSEVVTNAGLYGGRPIRLFGWLAPGEAVMTITDSGQGPEHPEAGLRPEVRDPGEGGFGLWLAHQLCSEVILGRHDHGFTVRLVARNQL